MEMLIKQILIFTIITVATKIELAVDLPVYRYPNDSSKNPLGQSSTYFY